ncbi:MAG: hypothetical protein RLY43_393 [Bacteroidota bacterium]|jgi:protein-tyrosine phosphatase
MLEFIDTTFQNAIRYYNINNVQDAIKQMRKEYNLQVLPENFLIVAQVEFSSKNEELLFLMRFS